MMLDNEKDKIKKDHYYVLSTAKISQITRTSE